MDFLSLIPMIGSLFKKKETNPQGLKDSTVTSNESTTGTSNTTQSVKEKETANTSAIGKTLGFEAGLMRDLNTMLGGATANSGITGSQSAIQAQMTDVAGTDTSFDVAGFVDKIVRGADSQLTADATANVNKIASQAGASTAGNSMVALLNARVQNDKAAQLGDIQAKATATGSEIATAKQTAKTGQMTQLAGANASIITNLIQSLAGAQSTSSQNQSSTALTDSLTKLMGTTTSKTTGKTVNDIKGV